MSAIFDEYAELQNLNSCNIDSKAGQEERFIELI